MANSYLDQAGLPRGLRNNSPGNLQAGDDWKGEVGEDSAGFVRFQDLAWGVRAMATVIVNNFAMGSNTITKLITKWAPPASNPTASYIARVCADTGLDPNQAIPFDMAVLASLIRAMINVELGTDYSPYVTNNDIQEGLQLMNSNLLALFTQVKQNPAIQIAVVVLLLLVGYVVYKGFRK